MIFDGMQFVGSNKQNFSDTVKIFIGPYGLALKYARYFNDEHFSNTNPYYSRANALEIPNSNPNGLLVIIEPYDD